MPGKTSNVSANGVDISATKEELKAAIRATADAAQAAIDGARTKGTDAASDAMAAGSAALENGRELAGGAQKAVESAVRRNPTASVLGALGAGLLIGYALSRRD